MLPPVTAVPATIAPAPQAASAAGAPPVQFAAKLDSPTAHDAADFAGAVEQSAPATIAAAVPQSAEGMASQLMRQIDQITQHLGLLHSSAAPHATSTPALAPTSPNALSTVHADMDASLAQMEHAYAFAIETTMASRGSTETTKIFNTLLKGQ